jgi:prepilin-type N-terminal cleavage/methylation domain-containing protein
LKHSRGSAKAFTLIELAVAIAIVGILVLLVSSNYKGIMMKVSKANCISNMRSLHVAFSSFVNDAGYWPQIPEQLASGESDYEDWWIETMEPYTGSEKVWLCPVLKAGRLSSADGRVLRMHYIPTQFDANRISPTRWPRQPWLIEMGDAHGDGALILFPDGAVQSLGQVLGKKK